MPQNNNQDNYKPERDDEGKFKPGESGNPDGKPKGAVSVVRALKRKLKEKYPKDSDVSTEEKLTYLDKIVEKYFDQAIDEEDTKMLKDIVDRVDGKPVQTNKVEADITSSELEERNEKLKEIFNEIKKDE